MNQKILFVMDEFYPVTSAPGVRISSFIDELKDYKVLLLGGNSIQIETISGNESFKSYPIFRPNEKNFLKFAYFLIKINLIAIVKTIKLRPGVTVISIPKYELLLSAPIIKIFSKKLVIDVRDSYNFINYEAYFNHFTSSYIAGFFGRLVKWSIGSLFHVSLFLADRITVANIGIFNSLGKSQHKARIVSNGVDTDLFKPSKIKTRKNDSVLNLVYMGNFAEKDDFSWFGSLAEDLKSQVVIHLIGDGRNRQKNVSFLEKNRINYVYHGLVDHKNLPTTLSKMDAGIIFREKSVKESIPVVIYEFSSMNLPTICNDAGIMAEFIRSKKLGEVVSDTSEMNCLFHELVHNKNYFNRYANLHEIAVKEFSRKEQAIIFRSVIENI